MQPKVSESFFAQLPAYFNVCVPAQPASLLSFYLFIFLDYLF